MHQHATFWKTQFRKLEITTKFIPNIVFECIFCPVDKQLNLHLEKQRQENETICEIFGAIDNVCKEMKYR